VRRLRKIRQTCFSKEGRNKNLKIGAARESNLTWGGEESTKEEKRSGGVREKTFYREAGERKGETSAREKRFRGKPAP